MIFESSRASAAQSEAFNAWWRAQIDKAGARSSEIGLMTLCGTADQVQATRILKHLKVTAINFGYGMELGPPASCDKANPPVSVRSPEAQPAMKAGVNAAAPSGIAVRREDIPGHWVIPGESCESDVVLTYAPDGSWAYMGDSGTWSVSGNQLTEFVIETGDLGDEPVKLKSPQRYVSTVTMSKTKMRKRDEKGEVIDLVRCPSL